VGKISFWVVGLKHIVSYLVKEIATLVFAMRRGVSYRSFAEFSLLRKYQRKNRMRKSKADTDTIQTEELLQAVVLADSFDTKFMPITLEMPRVSV